MATDAELRRAPDPRLHLELGLLKLVNAKRLAPLEEVLAELRGDSSGSKASGNPAAGSFGKPSLTSSAAGSASAAGSSGQTSASSQTPASTQVVGSSSGSSGAAVKMAPAPAFQMPPKLSSSSSSALPKLVIEPRPSVPTPNSIVVPVEPPVGRPEISSTATASVRPMAMPLAAGDSSKVLDAVRIEQIRSLLTANKFLLSMLDAVTSWEVENGELRLFFHPDNRSLSEMLQSKEPMERLRTALNQVLGQQLRVCVKLDSSRGVPTQPSSGNSSELRARFEQDPIVRAMLEKFGGQISNVKRPGGE